MKRKTRLFNMRVSARELKELQSIADYYGLNRSACVRFLIKESERKLEGLSRRRDSA